MSDMVAMLEAVNGAGMRRIPTVWKIYLVGLALGGAIWITYFYFASLRGNPSMPHWEAVTRATLSFVILNMMILVGILAGNLWGRAARLLRRLRGTDNYL